MSLLAGQTVIVAGGSRGIGRAAAEACAREGAAVVVGARDRDALEATVDAIAEAGGLATAVPGDVGDTATAERLLAAALDRHGGCDALINAAAVNGPVGEVETLDRAAWDAALRINLTGIFLSCRAVLPEMKRRGRGRILNFASGLAVRAQPAMAAYSAAKAGVVQFSRVLAEETRADGLLVNAVHPGIVRTGIVDELLALPREGARGSMVERLGDLRDRGAILEPEQTTGFILWLLAECGRSGEFIRIDEPEIESAVAKFEMARRSASRGLGS